MREAFEKCVHTVGGDILTANSLWSRYRSFELDETQDIMEITTGEISHIRNMWLWFTCFTLVVWYVNNSLTYFFKNISMRIIHLLLFRRKSVWITPHLFFNCADFLCCVEWLAGPSAAVQEAKKRVIDVFKRNLALPLIGVYRREHNVALYYVMNY